MAIPHLLSWILKALATKVYIIYIARFLAGIGSGCIFSVLPIYIAETISPKIRGTLGSLLTSMHFIGQFIVNILGNYCEIKTTSYICIPIVILFVILFSFMPESPYYLIIRCKDEEARKALRRLLRKANVDQELTNLKKDIERQLLEKGSWKELLFNDANRKAVSIAAFLRIVQQMGGVGVFVGTIKYIFDNAGGAISPDISTLVYTFSIIPFYCVAGFLVDRVGRRSAFVISMILSGSFLLIESIYFYIDKNLPGIDLTSMNWLPTVGMLFYVMVSSFGPGIIPTLMIGEIFSSSIKSYATIVAVFIFGIMCFIANQLFFLLNTYVGLFGPFLLFGCVNLLGAIVGYFYLPETKGKTLEEIQQDLKRNGKNSKKTLEKLSCEIKKSLQ